MSITKIWPAICILAGAALCALALASCAGSYERYTIQEAPASDRIAIVETLTELGFSIESSSSERVVTKWERYNVSGGAHGREIQLRVVAEGGRIKGQCIERALESWYFRPCKHSAGRKRISQALGAL